MPAIKRSSVAISLALLASAAYAAGADDGRASPPPADSAARIAPFVDDDTIAVAQVDLAKVDVDKLFAATSSFLPAQYPLSRMKDRENRALASLKQAGGRELYVIVSVADLPEHGPFAILPLAENSDEHAIEALVHPGTVAERIGDVLFIGTAGSRDRLRTATAVRRPELARALQAVGDSAAKFIVMPSAGSRRVVEELLPTLPDELGSGPATTLTRGALWVSLGVDIVPEPAVRLVIQSQSAETAQSLKNYLGVIFQRWPQVSKLAKTLSPDVKGDRLVLSLDSNRLTALGSAARPAVDLLTSSQRRLESTQHLKQIALAIHRFADAKKHFPPAAIADAIGRPLLSWRVAILPYLEQEALYKEFHLDEPWDSEHNRKLIDRMPDVYRSLGATAGGRTEYVVAVGPGSVFESTTATGFGEITDGTSNTIMAIEIGDEQAVTWTRPEDFTFDPQKPSAGLTTPYSDGRLLLFCDGSVHFITQSIDDETLRRLFVKNDGQVVPQLR
jgi:hypothetical protein